MILEYGDEVAESKRLISELEIADRVVWLPQTERRLLLLVLSMADVGIGQFYKGNYLNGVVHEVLASGKPLIHHYHHDRHFNTGFLKYPYIEADNPEAVARGLADLSHNPNKGRDLGEEAKRWYKKHVVERALEEYETRLGLKHDHLPRRRTASGNVDRVIASGS